MNYLRRFFLKWFCFCFNVFVSYSIGLWLVLSFVPSELTSPYLLCAAILAVVSWAFAWEELWPILKRKVAQWKDS